MDIWEGRRMCIKFAFEAMQMKPWESISMDFLVCFSQAKELDFDLGRGAALSFYWGRERGG